jgi:ABC-2 type transport system ATP-binding protein
MIRVEKLSKRFGEIQAVDGVSFEVRPGEIYGLLGPNGAGKTTTISMICGLLEPDSGSIHFEELDLASRPIQVKARLGVVPQETALYEELSARENLRFWGSLYGLSGGRLKTAVEETLERVGLGGRASDPVKSFSGGMKRRLNLALGLVHSPRAVLLDEPTVGIDPQARESILDLVRELAQGGMTVLYTTHYLEEAERLCDRIAIMDHGKILAEGTLEELIRMVGEGEVVTVTGSFPMEMVGSKIARLEGVDILSGEEGRLVLSVQGGGRGAAELLGTVFSGGLAVDGISIQPPSLNGLFLRLTGRELRD